MQTLPSRSMCLRFCRRAIGKPERVAFPVFGTHQDIFRFNILIDDTFAFAPTALDNYQMSLRMPPDLRKSMTRTASALLKDATARASRILDRWFIAHSR